MSEKNCRYLEFPTAYIEKSFVELQCGKGDVISVTFMQRPPTIQRKRKFTEKNNYGIKLTPVSCDMKFLYRWIDYSFQKEVAKKIKNMITKRRQLAILL